MQSCHLLTYDGSKHHNGKQKGLYLQTCGTKWSPKLSSTCDLLLANSASDLTCSASASSGWRRRRHGESAPPRQEQQPHPAAACSPILRSPAAGAFCEPVMPCRHLLDLPPPPLLLAAR
uniref:Uncharacterized protein n=1 Tax=Arundo donax TaxID=35708 RepID=A0A0A8YXQ8_ARUDO